jgi:hypothetical protein
MFKDAAVTIYLKIEKLKKLHVMDKWDVRKPRNVR